MNAYFYFIDHVVQDVCYQDCTEKHNFTIDRGR